MKATPEAKEMTGLRLQRLPRMHRRYPSRRVMQLEKMNTEARFTASANETKVINIISYKHISDQLVLNMKIFHLRNFTVLMQLSHVSTAPA
ncbi:hypothetical protein TNIN_309881 [Trichonephila inaurata madagascariensis]|uniref:Uncharacterized protein n=1 Tax=Trichonephila inaurata madagascariensis TaxID=2747483 RepID=A0A8X6YRQ0_9ARAC|nr:hypothetical protein TNIN_309881 [Trichonephila inaurata madagascariensis]